MSPAFAEEDDSTPYMPYPETPQPVQPPAKPPAKKPAAKKKTPAKRPAAKKTPAKRTPTKPAPRPSSLQQGIALMQQEKYEQAKPYLLKAIQENKNDPNAWYWYGMYHEKTGGFYQAQYFYSKAVTIDPAFEPLSRVVYYPDDPDKTPLWDPKRPARVYPVEVANNSGILPGRSDFPDAPNDPEMPHVPVYTPPDPASNPLNDGSWNPAVYVPPRPEEVDTEGEISPVYLPPEPQNIIVDDSPATRQVLEVPMYAYPEGTVSPEIPARIDTVVRADKPLYSPPKPGEKAPVPPQQTPPTPQSVKPKPKTPKVTPQRTASIPTSRVVRQAQKKKATPQKSTPTVTRTRRQPQPERGTTSRDVRPQTPPQPTRQQPPARQQTPPPPPVVETPPSRQQNPEYFPPVGQNAPDPGTIPEVEYIPPVNQGSQY